MTMWRRTWSSSPDDQQKRNQLFCHPSLRGSVTPWLTFQNLTIWFSSNTFFTPFCLDVVRTSAKSKPLKWTTETMSLMTVQLFKGGASHGWSLRCGMGEHDDGWCAAGCKVWLVSDIHQQPTCSLSTERAGNCSSLQSCVGPFQEPSSKEQVLVDLVHWVCLLRAQLPV